MGVIDALFLLDNAQLPIFHYSWNTKVPDFNYIQSQLLTLKRESLYRNGVDVSTNIAMADYVFDSNINGTISSFSPSTDLVILPPILEIDSDWSVAWSRLDNIYVVTVFKNKPELVDVQSDNEDSDDDDDDEDDDEDEDDDDDGETDQIKVESGYRKQYSSLPDDEDEISDESPDSNVDSIESNDNQSTTSNHSKDQVKQISNTTNPLQFLQLHRVLIDSIKLIIQSQNLTPHKIQLNSHRIIMLMGELADSSIPFVTDQNQLRESLPNNSIIDKLLSSSKQLQNSAISSLSHLKKGESIDVPKLPKFSPKYHFVLERSGSTTPWRRLQVDNAQNEVFIDVTESVELIVSQKTKSNKLSRNTFSNYNDSSNIDNSDYLKAVIHGHVDLSTSLEGAPLLEISMNIPPEIPLVNSYPSLNRGVKKSIWRNSNGTSIQLIPADEKSNLLSYHIDLKQIEKSSPQNFTISKYTGAINAELYSGIGIGRNEFEIIINTGNGLNSGFGNTETSIKEIDHLSVEIVINDFKTHTEDQRGTSHENLALKVVRSSTGTITQLDSGNYEWNIDTDSVIGGKLTLRGSFTFEDEDKSENILPSFLKVKYKHHGIVPSGIKIKSINVTTDTSTVKPFKGVKYTSVSNNYIVS